MKFLHDQLGGGDQPDDLPPMETATLNFVDQEWERSYKAAIREGNLQQVRRAFAIGIILNTMFVPLDYYTLPANGGLFAMIRGLGINGIFAVLLGLSFIDFWRTRWPALIFAGSIVYSSFQGLTNVFGEIDRPIDAGFILMIFIIYSLFPLFYTQAATIALVCTALFLGIGSVAAFDGGETGTAVAGIMLILSANVVGFFALRRLEMLRRRAFARSVIIDQERNKVRELLDRILPATVARRLREGNAQTTERLSDVAVLFADLQDFTTLAASCEPEETLSMLSEVFEKFDDLVEKHGVEKIKTIGDAYMVAAGAPPGAQSNVQDIAALACDMVQVVQGMKRPDGAPLNIRVGISSGPLIAGVVGDSRFLYDLWGDPVNTASRMETTGEGGRIQVTEDVVLALGDRYVFEARGEVDIKGKGPMQTWWMSSSPPESIAAE